MLFQRMYFIGELVGKFFTDGVIILHRRKMTVSETVKCCSVKINFFLIINHVKAHFKFSRLKKLHSNATIYMNISLESLIEA